MVWMLRGDNHILFVIVKLVLVEKQSLIAFWSVCPCLPVSVLIVCQSAPLPPRLSLSDTLLKVTLSIQDDQEEWLHMTLC